jgi:hypothetical protein
MVMQHRNSGVNFIVSDIRPIEWATKSALSNLTINSAKLFYVDFLAWEENDFSGRNVRASYVRKSDREK